MAITFGIVKSTRFKISIIQVVHMSLLNKFYNGYCSSGLCVPKTIEDVLDAFSNTVQVMLQQAL